jgi:parallel beta-helix repeat protein
MKRTVSGIKSTILLVSMLMLAFNLKSVRAEPKTWVVDDNGPADFHTIQEAVDAASIGDTILVKSGTYLPVLIDKSVSIEGENRSTTIIDGGGVHETYITFMADNAQICNFTIQHLNCIYVDSYVGIGIFNNIILDNFQGIRLVHTSGNIIADNIIDGNSAGDIGFDWANNSIVRNNTLTNSGGLAAIHGGYPSYNNVFFENKVFGNNLAIEMNNIFNDNKFYHNNFINNTMQVSFTGPLKVNTWNNDYPSGGNFWSDYSGNDTCSGPYQNETGSDSIGDSVYVIDENNRDGFPLMRSYVLFENQTIHIRADGSVDPSGAPILRKGELYTFTCDITSNADGIVIERNSITLDGTGHVVDVDGHDLCNGITIENRENVTIRNVIITDIGFEAAGIYLNSSSNNFILANTIRGDDRYSIGLALEGSSDNLISENRITGGVGLWFFSREPLSCNNMVSENDITGCYYYAILSSGNFNTFSSNNIENNAYYGIELDGWNCSIFRNNIANNYWGIVLYSGCNSVVGNNIANNGICVDGVGIELRGNHNTLTGNNIANNYYGLELSGYNNIINQCNVTGNNYGILLSLDSSSNNSIYHNNFDNTEQFYIEESGSASFWDDGYPSGGNYWSDYTGIDVNHGFYQNVTGSDGIGDTSYVIDENNIDHYPLMSPWAPTSAPIISGEVQILEPEGDFVGVGSLDITFSITDMGDPVEFKKGDAYNRIDLEIEFIDKAFGVKVWSTSSDGLTLDLGQTLTETVTYDATSQEVYGDVIIRIVHWKYNSTTESYEYGEFGMHEVRGTLLPPLSGSLSPLSASINVGQSVTFTSTVSGGYTPYAYQWYLDRAPVSGATSDTWIFKPTSSGTFYIYLKVTDARTNTVQSETARIAVTAVPVGGYSLSTGVQTATNPPNIYVATIAVLAAVFTILKRKTRKTK